MRAVGVLLTLGMAAVAVPPARHADRPMNIVLLVEPAGPRMWKGGIQNAPVDSMAPMRTLQASSHVAEA